MSRQQQANFKPETDKTDKTSWNFFLALEVGKTVGVTAPQAVAWPFEQSKTGFICPPDVSFEKAASFQCLGICVFRVSDIWPTYILLSQVEAAFRAMKSPRCERPIFILFCTGSLPGAGEHLLTDLAILRFCGRTCFWKKRLQVWCATTVGLPLPRRRRVCKAFDAPPTKLSSRKACNIRNKGVMSEGG